MFNLTRIAAVAFVVTSCPAYAQDYTVGSLKIERPWARATPKGASVGGGYFTITNAGSEPDRLIRVSSSVAKKVEVHEMSMDKGVAKMRPVSGGLEIGPGKTVELKPDGYHLMLLGLNRPLKQGDKVSASLEFAKAGKVQVEFTVEGLGATSAPPTMPGMGH